MATYPDNQFENDQLEPDQYGGQPAGVIDQNAWTWITGLVRSISKRVLSHVRVGFSSGVSVAQEGVVPGDVLVIDLSLDATDPATQASMPYVCKWITANNAGHEFKIIGVAVVAASALGKVQYAAGGLVSQTISGLASMTAGVLLGVDPVTNKMRAWVTGDDSVGYSSPNGNVLLLFAGRVA